MTLTRQPSDCLQAIWTVDDLADFPTSSYAIHFPILDAGESFTCRFSYEVNPAWPHTVEVDWFVFDARLALDLNPANNRLDMYFRATPPPIPTLNATGLLAFALALAAAFFVVRRR